MDARTVLTSCLVFWILSVEEKANSLHNSVDTSSRDTNTKGFVILSIIARAWLLFLAMMLAKKDCLAYSLYRPMCHIEGRDLFQLCSAFQYYLLSFYQRSNGTRQVWKKIPFWIHHFVINPSWRFVCTAISSQRKHRNDQSINHHHLSP